MNFEEIISSGQLELYALGALEAEEKAKVEKLISEHAELRQEYEKIAKSLETYAKSEAIEAPAQVLERAKAEINNESSEMPIPMVNKKPRNFGNMWAIAASFLLLASFLWNIQLRSDLRESQQELVAMEAQNQQLAATSVKLSTHNQQMNELIASTAKEGVLRTRISSTPDYEGMESVIYWNPNEAEIILATQDLPVLNQNEQYQLWAIVEGKPVDLGVFDAADRIAKMKQVDGTVQAFAVTIEPKGGSVEPSLDKMCMLGNVSG